MLIWLKLYKCIIKVFFYFDDIYITKNKELCMIEEKLADVQEVFFEVNNGEYVKVDMTLPLQMLFDDVMTFVSITDF